MNEDHNDRARTPQEALQNFLRYVDDDPRTMDEADLDLFLADSGLDFEAFDIRLTEEVTKAHKRARLLRATEERHSVKARITAFTEIASMTISAKRAEIQYRLGLLGGQQAAAVFNRSYEAAETDDDVDALLVDLRALDERANEDGV